MWIGDGGLCLKWQITIKWLLKLVFNNSQWKHIFEKIKNENDWAYILKIYVLNEV